MVIQNDSKTRNNNNKPNNVTKSQLVKHLIFMLEIPWPPVPSLRLWHISSEAPHLS